jgi:hypothetical protein
VLFHCGFSVIGAIIEHLFFSGAGAENVLVQ